MSLEGARSPLSAVFLLHIAFEFPIAIQGLLSGGILPFLDMNNTSLVMLKLYGALVFGACLCALLVFPLPEFLPGKRAFAIMLLAYHTIVASVLFSAPRFIPHSFGAVAEQANFTPEKLWGGLHGVLSLGFGFWWQGTLGFARAIKRE